MYKKVGLRRAQRKLIVARELVTRCFAEQLRDCDLMTNPELVRTYLTAQFAPLEREVFACLYLDTRHRIIGNIEVLFQGTIDAATVHPREVVKSALRRNAAAVILAHNRLCSGKMLIIKITMRLTARRYPHFSALESFLPRSLEVV